MNISITSFLSSQICSSFLILFLCLVIVCTGKTLYIHPHYVWLCILLIIIRSLIPYEFFYTITITSKSILPSLQRILNLRIPFVRISIFYFILFIWILVALIKVIKVIYIQCKAEWYIRNLPDSKNMLILQQLLFQLGIKKTIRLIEVPGIMTPAIIGITHSLIVIPDNIPENNLQYILLHELEHYKRKDLYFIAILQMICIIYWWNPLFYILKKNAEKIIELRVDSSVTQNLDKKQKIDYLQSILNIAKSRNNIRKITNNILGLGFYEKQSDLDERLQIVLHGSGKYPQHLLPRIALLLVFLSTSIIFEPYAIKAEDEIGTFNNTQNSYIIDRNNYYEWYVDDECIRLERIEGLEEIPIYKSSLGN